MEEYFSSSNRLLAEAGSDPDVMDEPAVADVGLPTEALLSTAALS